MPIASPPQPHSPADAQRRLHRLLLLLVLMISAFVQLTVVARSETLIPIRADAASYFSYAWNLRHHGTYSATQTWRDPAIVAVPDKLSPPGYALFVAVIPGLQPDLSFVLRVGFAQALLGVLSVWLVYLVGASFLPPAAALAAALLAALSPHLAMMSTYLLTESLFQFMLLASLFASLRAARGDRLRAWCGAGLLWGACSLVRPTMQFLPPLFLAAAWLLPKLRPQRRAAAVLFLGFALVQAPWQLRNLTVPTPPGTPNLLVSFLQHGSYPDFKYHGREDSKGAPYRFDPDIERITRDVPSVLRNIAANFQAEPLTYARWYLLGKPLQFMAWENVGGFGDIYTYPPLHTPFVEDARFALLRQLMWYLHWPLMLLGVAGAAGVAWRPRLFGISEAASLPARMAAAVVLYAIAFHMVGAPFPRYGFPFRGLFYVFAMAALAALPLRWQRVRAA